MAETQRIELNGNSYDTVSRNLTITGAQMEDEGIYHCNVTDGNGRVFSASKKVTVYGICLIMNNLCKQNYYPNYKNVKRVLRIQLN